MHQEEQLEDQDDDNNDPFFYYHDTHVQESIDLCNNSILGKILADKHIPSPVLFNSLAGIWGKPTDFKINELEGKILQFKMNKEEDIQRILKGSPWIIRNCWLVLHNWSRNLDLNTLDFTNVPIWIQF